LNETVLQLKTRIKNLNEKRYFCDIEVGQIELISGQFELRDNERVSSIPNVVEIRVKYRTLANVECSQCYNFLNCFVAPCGHYYCFGCFSETFLRISNERGVFSCASDIDNIASGNNTCGFVFNNEVLSKILNFHTEFEENIYIALNRIHLSSMQTKQCPTCKTECQRTNMDVKLRCNTSQCNGRNFFCWYCGFAWKNNNNVRECGNDDCINEDPILKSLIECGNHEICGVSTPKMRLCPYCNCPYYHSGRNCKFIHGCFSCKKGWCFICLKGERTENGAKKPMCSNGWYDACIPANIQTTYAGFRKKKNQNIK